MDSTKDAVTESLKTINGKLDKAECVLVVGGGAVGCETAGELATQFPKKKIILVHSKDRVLSAHPGISPKLQDKVQAFLSGKSCNVEIILGERVDDIQSLIDSPDSAKTIKTDKGREIKSDYQIVCTGFKLNTDYLKAFNDGKCLDDKGYVKTNSYYQVEGAPNMFAL